MRKVEGIKARGMVLEKLCLMPRALTSEYCTVLLFPGGKWGRVSRLHHTMGQKWEAQQAVLHKGNPEHLKSCPSIQQPWSR